MTEPNTEAFDRLVAALPAIADAIQIFESPEVQAHALDALPLTLLGRTSAFRPGSRNGSAPGEPAGDRMRSEAATGLSVGEFLEECNAKRMPDKITTIAAWVMDTARREAVTRDEVKAEFRNAGEATPGTNYARDFNAAVSLRFLAPVSGGSNEFYVTKTGRAAIAEKFSAEVRKAVPQKRPARKRAPKAAEA